MPPDVAPVSEYIVYACPTETLGRQIDDFMERSAREVGPNAAHPYPPHITLTGFFRDTADACSLYGDALHRAHEAILRGIELPIVRIRKLQASPQFIGLRIESPVLLSLAEYFARHPQVAARPEAVRLKCNLHLSLAYGFPKQQYARLRALAERTIDLRANVGWCLRYYERRAGDQWVLHRQWQLP